MDEDSTESVRKKKNLLIRKLNGYLEICLKRQNMTPLIRALTDLKLKWFDTGATCLCIDIDCVQLIQFLSFCTSVLD